MTSHSITRAEIIAALKGSGDVQASAALVDAVTDLLRVEAAKVGEALRVAVAARGGKRMAPEDLDAVMAAREAQRATVVEKLVPVPRDDYCVWVEASSEAMARSLQRAGVPIPKLPPAPVVVTS